MDDIGPAIDTIETDVNGVKIPLSLYAYVASDKTSSVMYLQDRSTRILFVPDANLITERSESLSFKLPKGNYIMPVVHDTEANVIQSLKFYMSTSNQGNIYSGNKIVVNRTITTPINMPTTEA